MKRLTCDLHSAHNSAMTEHITQGDVHSLDQLRDKAGEFYTGTVDVTGSAYLAGLGLERLPVRFGAVDGSFWCDGNRLTSLEGAPGSVGRHFSCDWNRLTSLVGAPASVGGSLNCRGNRLTSLVGAHRILRRIDGRLHLWENGIVTGGIGLILVDGLREISSELPAFKIINAHLGQGMKGLLRCQEALHDAGFGAFAKL